MSTSNFFGNLEVGTNGRGEVVVNHPELQADENGVGHIVFSPKQARILAATLIKKSVEADEEAKGGTSDYDRLMRDVKLDRARVPDGVKNVVRFEGKPVGYIIKKRLPRRGRFAMRWIGYLGLENVETPVADSVCDDRLVAARAVALAYLRIPARE